MSAFPRQLGELARERASAKCRRRMPGLANSSRVFCGLILRDKALTETLHQRDEHTDGGAAWPPDEIHAVTQTIVVM